MPDRSPTLLERLKAWARRLKREVTALWIAARDPRTPWSAKLVAGAVAAYALSPIDLIPDVIPVLGYLDDLLIVPLGVMFAVRLIPPELMAEFRAAAQLRGRAGKSIAGLAAVVVIWLATGAFAAWLFWPHVMG